MDKPEQPDASEDLQQYIAQHPYGWQDANGIDLTLIAANLRLTPDQRLRRAQEIARRLARMVDDRIS